MTAPNPLGQLGEVDEPTRLWAGAPCGLLVTDDDGVVVAANDTFLRALGLDRHDVVGRVHFVELLTGGGRIYHETHFVPMLRMHGEVTALALDLRSGDGGRYPVLVNARRQVTDAGARTHIATFAAKERREYERELLRAKQRAEASEARAVALSHSLQQTFYPPLTPRVEGLQIATAYRPAGVGDEVGGDFYDIFQVAPDEWVVAIGDVEGKGVGAAAVTALARHVIRASSARFASPGEALRTLNDVLLGAGAKRFLTAVVLRLARRPGGWDVTCAVAGHTAPLLRRAGEEPSEVAATGMLLGVVAAPVITETNLELRPGDLVLLTTDGIQEARHSQTREFYEQDRVIGVATRAATVHELVDTLVGEVVDFSAGTTRDDLAVVALAAVQQETDR